MKDFKFIGEGLKCKVDGKYTPNFNVLNILRSIMDDGSSEIYIPYDYKRGTAKHVMDPKVHYMAKEAGKPLKVVGIQSNQSRFNFSLTCVVPVIVEAEEDGNVYLLEKKVYRQYNIIRDGKLAIDYLIAKLSEDSFYNLRDSGILYYNGMVVPSNHMYNKDFFYKVSFIDVPLVSLNWAQPINIGLYNYMKEEIDISSVLQVIRKLIKKYKNDGQEIAPLSYYDDVYQETYSGQSEQTDTYSADCIVYEIKGYKPVVVEETIEAAYPDLISATKAKRDMDNKLKNIRFIIRCVIFAIENSNKKGSYNWSEKTLVPRSKEKYEQFADVTTDEGVINLRRLEYKETVSV